MKGRARAQKATPIDACTLLSASEVSQAIGVPVDAGARKDDGWVDNDSIQGA